MVFTFATLCTCFAVTGVLMILLSILCNALVPSKRLSLYVPLVIGGIIALRSVLPFEWSFTHTFLVPGIYSTISAFFHKSVLEVGPFDVSVFYVVVGVSLSVTIAKLTAMLIKQHFYGVYLSTLPVDECIEVEGFCGRIRHIKCVKDPLACCAMTVGLIRPYIVFPALTLSDNERKMIISHELAHIRNHDVLIKYGVEMVCLLYWWNPLMKALYKTISDSLEKRADSSVVSDFSEVERIDYLECLLRMTKYSNTKDDVFILGFNRDGYAVKDRFNSILNPEYSKGLSVVVVVCMLLVATTTSFVTFEPYGTPDEVGMAVFGGSEKPFFEERSDGMFDFYSNGEYVGTIERPLSFESLDVKFIGE